MSNLKKLMCNPPAELVAMHGDPKVCGMFRGAGDALKYLSEGLVRDTFARRITDCEEAYMEARDRAANEAITTMKVIFDEMVFVGQPKSNKK